jgi:hypothetical protein
MSDFMSHLPQGSTVAGTESLNVKSDYFYVTVEAQQGTTMARARALVRRTNDGKWPAIVWQVVE